MTTTLYISGDSYEVTYLNNFGDVEIKGVTVGGTSVASSCAVLEYEGNTLLEHFRAEIIREMVNPVEVIDYSLEGLWCILRLDEDREYDITDFGEWMKDEGNLDCYLPGSEERRIYTLKEYEQAFGVKPELIEFIREQQPTFKLREV